MDAAQSLERAARERQQVADQQLADFQRIEFEQKKARTVERVSNARLEWTQSLQQRQADADPEAQGFTPKVLNDFDKWRATSSQAISDEEERRLFDGMVAPLRDHLAGSALQFETTQRRTYRKSVVRDGAEIDARTVTADPAQFQDVLASRLAVINGSADLMPEDRTALADAATQLIAGSAAVTLADRDPVAFLERAGMAGRKGGGKADPAAAAAAVKQDPLLASLTPQQLRQVIDRASANKAAMEGRAKMEQDVIERMAFDATQEAASFADEGLIPSTEQVNRWRMLTSGTRYAEAAEMHMKAAVEGAGFGALPLAAKRAVIMDAEGQPTDTAAAKRLDRFRAIEQAQAKAYADDPWNAQQRFHRGPDVQEVRITAPGQLLEVAKQRIPLMARLEAASGQPAPLLRPNEVPQAVAALQSASIRERTEVLGQLGAALPANRVAVLADQLGKGDDSLALALKMGSEKTTAGRMVSELVLIGKQALKDKTVKKDDSALAGWRNQLAPHVRGVFGPGEGGASVEDDIINAAFYVMAAQEVENIGGPNFSKGIGGGAEDALNLVVGRPLNRGGVKTLMPRGMTEAAFDSAALKALSAFADQTVYVRGQPVPVERLAARLSSYGMRITGRNTYTPVISNLPVTRDKEGRVMLELVLP